MKLAFQPLLSSSLIKEMIAKIILRQKLSCPAEGLATKTKQQQKSFQDSNANWINLSTLSAL